MNERDWTPEPWPTDSWQCVSPIIGGHLTDDQGHVIYLSAADYLRAAQCVNACAHLNNEQLAGGVVSADLLEKAIDHHGPACKSECDHPSCVLYRNGMAAVNAARKAAG